MNERLRKGATWLGGGVGALVLAVGALHLPCARSLLMRAGGCPFASPLTVAQSDQARRMGVAAVRGTGVAPARPAMVFTIDDTTLDQAQHWARDNRLACDQPRAGAFRCNDVPAQALGLQPSPGSNAEVWLMFDGGGKLVNATTWRSHLAADVAAKMADQIAASLASRLGQPMKAFGGFDPQHLSNHTADSVGTLSYHFGDYVAEVGAVNLPNSGVAVREHYVSARD